MYEWAGQYERLTIIDRFLSITRTVNSSYHVYGSFGDVYIQVALIKEKFDSSNIGAEKHKICIFISPKYEQLILYTFRDASEYVVVWLIENNLANLIFNNINLLGRHENYPIRLLPTLYPLIAELINSGKLLYLDFMRNLIGSNCIGKIGAIESALHEEEARRILADNNIRLGKTVLICADNNSQATFSGEFWTEVINAVTHCGWEVCINDSGNITNDETVILGSYRANLNIKFLKIPPHLPISLTKLMGSYIGGSNGFITICAHFAESTRGLHLINCLESENGFNKTPGGELIPIDCYFSRNSARGCEQGIQIEVPIFTMNDLVLVKQNIRSMLLAA